MKAGPSLESPALFVFFLISQVRPVHSSFENELKNAFLGDGRNEFLEVERLEIRRILETLFGVKLLRRQQH